MGRKTFTKSFHLKLSFSSQEITEKTHVLQQIKFIRPQQSLVHTASSWDQS